MRSTILIGLLFFLSDYAVAQLQSAFDFDTDLPPDAVESIFINLNFNLIDEIPATISRFSRLKELTIFAQNEVFHANNWNKYSHKSVDLRESQIKSIPAAISKCPELEILQIREGNIKSLPNSFNKLGRLRVLTLPPGSDLDSLVSQILQLSSLIKLHCLDCTLTEANRELLKHKFPSIQLVISINELLQEIQSSKEYRVDINGRKGIVFLREIEAEMFVQSIPEDQRTFFNVTIRR